MWHSTRLGYLIFTGIQWVIRQTCTMCWSAILFHRNIFSLSYFYLNDRIFSLCNKRCDRALSPASHTYKSHLLLHAACHLVCFQSGIVIKNFFENMFKTSQMGQFYNFSVFHTFIKVTIMWKSVCDLNGLGSVHTTSRAEQHRTTCSRITRYGGFCVCLPIAWQHKTEIETLGPSH